MATDSKRDEGMKSCVVVMRSVINPLLKFDEHKCEEEAKVDKEQRKPKRVDGSDQRGRAIPASPGTLQQSSSEKKWWKRLNRKARQKRRN